MMDPKEARAEAERELERGIELLRRAHEEKLKAIQVLEMMGGGVATTSAVSSNSQGGLKRGELPKAFERILPKLDEPFDKDQVFRALEAFEGKIAAKTDERSVSLLLSRLARKDDGPIEVAEKGEGSKPTSFRKKRSGPRAVEPAAPEDSSPVGSNPLRALEQ